MNLGESVCECGNWRDRMVPPRREGIDSGLGQRHVSCGIEVEGRQASSSHFAFELLALARKLRDEAGDSCIRVVVSQDLTKVRAFFSHQPGSGLAQSDSMSLAAAFHDHLFASLSHSEVVALDGI